MERKEDTNRRAVVFRLGVTFNTDPAPVSFNKILCYEEPDPGTHSRSRGEESVKDVRQNLRGDALAIVCHVQGDAVGWSCSITDRNGKGTPIGHSVNRVDDQV